MFLELDNQRDAMVGVKRKQAELQRRLVDDVEWVFGLSAGTEGVDDWHIRSSTT